MPKVTTKHRITIPAEAGRELGIGPTALCFLLLILLLFPVPARCAEENGGTRYPELPRPAGTIGKAPVDGENEPVMDVVPPEIETPDVKTPEVETPDIETPDVIPPDVSTPDVETPDVKTPDVDPPDVSGTDVETTEITPEANQDGQDY